MNAIRGILEDFVRTGQFPEREAVTQIMAHGTLSEREELRRGIHRATLQLRNLQDDDDHSNIEAEIEDVIDGAAEKYAHLVRGSAGRDDVAGQGRESSFDTAGIERRREAAQAARKRRAPLQELLAASARAGGIDPRDLDGIVLRADISAAEREKFRSDVAAAGRRVGREWAAGNQAASRKLAADLAERLEGNLSEVGPNRDPLADVDDPRQLADAIRARGRGDA